MPWTGRAVFWAESRQKPYGVISAVLAQWVDLWVCCEARDLQRGAYDGLDGKPRPCVYILPVAGTPKTVRYADSADQARRFFRCDCRNGLAKAAYDGVVFYRNDTTGLLTCVQYRFFIKGLEGIHVYHARANAFASKRLRRFQSV